MKNKLISALMICFASFFVVFVIYVTDELSKANPNILKSPNVADVTDIISTSIKVTKSSLTDEWFKKSFDDSTWTKIKIPRFQAVKISDFRPGNQIYYRIKIPKESFETILHLEEESFLVLHAVFLSKFDIYINEDFYKTYKPVKTGENRIIIPVDDKKENIVAIKGYISAGDTGIDSRERILLGKGVEFHEVHRASYKSQSVFPLVFILSKGSILFVFALMYLLVRVDKSFDKFFIFGICAVIEELIAGDYLYGPLNFHQMVYLYSFVNFIASLALFLFFSDVSIAKWSKSSFYRIASFLGFIAVAVTLDAIYTNYIVDISGFMRFWNYIVVIFLSVFLPKIFKFDKVLFTGFAIVISLYLIGALYGDIGLNLKAYGNLLLFSMVAYQTFGLFRRDQDELQIKKLQLVEQEKDVAIAKTASLLAHDVRKPLEQIKLVFDKINSNDYDPGFLKVAKEDIDQSVQNVNQLVNEIMDINKTSKLELVETSFYRALGHALKQVMSVHEEMSISLDYDLQAQNKILADSKSLTTVLVNLISNSVEAIRDIGGKFEGNISFKTYVNNEKFYFQIANDGPRIPNHLIGEIFKPLFTHGKANGTGLGLASVAKTVAQHKGKILVSNLEKGGVAFEIILDAKGIDENFQKVEFHKSSKEYSYSKSETVKPKDSEAACNVLILDNIKENVDRLKVILSKISSSTNFFISNSSDEVLEQIQKKRYDLYFISKGCDTDSKVRTALNYLIKELIAYSNIDEINDSVLASCLSAYSNRPKVLFVDDTKMFRIAWQSFHGNHNIECKSSPEDALALLSQRQGFDVFVLDYHFSNSSMNGVSLAQNIKEFAPQATILIASSANEGSEGFTVISKRDYDVRRFISGRSKI